MENQTLEDVKKAFEEEGIEYSFPHTMTLNKPLEFPNGSTITELEFKREIDAEMLEELPMDTGSGISLQMRDYYVPISKMTNKPLAIIKKLKAGDIMEAIKIFNYFFAESQ